MSFQYKASFNVVFGSCFSVARHIFLSVNLSQSEFSEKMGFNRRLLSKYELGTSNISYATYIYIWECLNVDRKIADEILQTVIQGLAQKGIYVYLSLDNISLTNNALETRQKNYVKNSYLYIQDWFGFKYDFDVKDKFYTLESIDYKKLDGFIEKIFRDNDFYQLSKFYRRNLINKKIEKLREELKNLQSDYVRLSLDENFSLKIFDQSEKDEIDLLLIKMKEIKNRLDELVSIKTRNQDRKSVDKSIFEGSDFI